MALVVLPDPKVTELAFNTKLPLWPSVNAPLLVIAPEAFSVKVEVFPALAAVLIRASGAIVKSP